MGRIPLLRLEKAARFGRRSSLFVYMFEHYADLRGVLAEIAQPVGGFSKFAARGATRRESDQYVGRLAEPIWACSADLGSFLG